MIAALIAVSSAGSVPVTDTAYGQIATIEDTTEVAEATGTVAIVDTESAVRSYFSDIPVLIEVARCESTFRHTLADGTVLKGRVDNRDIGVMQINSYYHGTEAAALGLDLYNLQDNMKYARILYEKQGTLPWKSSSACWSRTLASA